MIVDYCTQRDIISSSCTGLIFQHAKRIFTKIPHSSLFFFFLFKNVLIRLASAKNLVYNTQFVA